MLVKHILSLGALIQGIGAILVENGSLRANGAYNAISVDNATPRLTWRLGSHERGDAQTAYQIQASTSDKFASDIIWDSGKVRSKTPFSTYAGKNLQSRNAVFWRVKVWNVHDTPSGWSDTGRFQVSLLNGDDWSASWIANKGFKTGETSLPVFAKEFLLDCEVSSAHLYLLGLGLHVPEINGQEITDEVLQPGYSTVNYTLPYSTYDVAKYLKKGENVLAVALGKGIYDAEVPLLGRYKKFSQAYQELKLIAQLEYQCQNGKGSGRIVSDDSWLTTLDGPYWETSWYGGEEYDARKELADWSNVNGDRTTWKNASITTGPSGKLVSPRSPPLKRVETVKPISVTKNEKGFWVYDFGVNFAGSFKFTIKNQDHLEGTRITFWPDELPGLGQSSTGTPIFDAYTLSNSSSQTYSPRFLYHGYQYLGVNTTWQPSLSDVEGYVIRAANEAVLNFTSSSEQFNRIHTIIDRSIQSNMHSVLTDCPHREKYGWLEQDHLVFEPLALGYDIQAYGDDLIRTITDAQAKDTPGLIPDIAPEFGNPMGGGYRNDPNWGRAVINVPYQLYQYYGDVEILKRKHQYMAEYLQYLQGRAGGKPYINDGGLGDWLAIDTTTPKGVTDTFGYHQAAFYMSKIEAILGNEDSSKFYGELADSIIEGFNSMWLNTTIPDSPYYCPTNTQACNAFAIDMGAVSNKDKPSVLSALVRSIEARNGLMSVGEIALPSLFRVLRDAKRDDILFKWISSTEMPSYGYMLEHGATSLWEHWDADKTGGSLNHFMYGYGDLFLLQLSGLSQRNTSVAWSEIVYDPIVQEGLSHASTSYLTPSGIASANWSLNGSDFDYSLTVPVGSRGWVYIPTIGEIYEGKKLVKADEDGVVSVRKGCKRTLVVVGSGSYGFSVKIG